MDGLLIVLQLLVVLAAIVLGVRMGGMGLGIWGAVGVAVLVFVFRLAPGDTPVNAILIILAVITAAAVMQAAGGIDYLVTVAARIIRANPRQVTLIAPLVSFAFVVGAGTSNVFFPLIPVIYEVSHSAGVRPERPLGVSVIATGLGITASPVSAAMAAMIALTASRGLGLNQILAITIPSSLAAIVVAALVSMRLGKDLADDPLYQARLKQGLVKKARPLSDSAAEAALPAGARRSAFIFLAGVVVVVLIGAVPWFNAILPEGTDMTIAIQLIMFLVALAILISCNVKVATVFEQPVFSSGVTALIALLGIAWLANTFIAAHLERVVGLLGGAVSAAPLAFALAVFIVAALTTSQSATTNTIVPMGLALSALGAGSIVAMWQAVTGVFFLPANGPQLAAVALDLTGSTRIGGYVLNHSFMVPLLVSTPVAVGVGMLLAQVFGFNG
ncbi:MAG: anaerobic C4-dicarboxylate transporter [Ardenticatenia bacterium]|nr:anaerobic C4-dicarboxylate transporter [Ardenticatenia bacterium]